jgi:hypothetical protein
MTWLSELAQRAGSLAIPYSIPSYPLSNHTQNNLLLTHPPTLEQTKGAHGKKRPAVRRVDRNRVAHARELFLSCRSFTRAPARCHRRLAVLAVCPSDCLCFGAARGVTLYANPHHFTCCIRQSRPHNRSICVGEMLRSLYSPSGVAWPLLACLYPAKLFKCTAQTVTD